MQEAIRAGRDIDRDVLAISVEELGRVKSIREVNEEKMMKIRSFKKEHRNNLRKIEISKVRYLLDYRN